MIIPRRNHEDHYGILKILQPNTDEYDFFLSFLERLRSQFLRLIKCLRTQRASTSQLSWNNRCHLYSRRSFISFSFFFVTTYRFFWVTRCSDGEIGTYWPYEATRSLPLMKVQLNDIWRFSTSTTCWLREFITKKWNEPVMAPSTYSTTFQSLAMCRIEDLDSVQTFKRSVRRVKERQRYTRNWISKILQDCWSISTATGVIWN